MDEIVQQKPHWHATIQDLIQRRAAVQADLEELDRMIGGLKRMAGEMPLQSSKSTVAVIPPIRPTRAVVPPAEPSGRFSNMSVRWGVLWLLSEDLESGATTAEIAMKLVGGGVVSKSANFNSNVSAVLSAMRDRAEVSQSGPKWEITDSGRQAWFHIKASRGFVAPK